VKGNSTNRGCDLFFGSLKRSTKKKESKRGPKKRLPIWFSASLSLKIYVSFYYSSICTWLLSSRRPGFNHGIPISDQASVGKMLRKCSAINCVRITQIGNPLYRSHNHIFYLSKSFSPPFPRNLCSSCVIFDVWNFQAPNSRRVELESKMSRWIRGTSLSLGVHICGEQSHKL